MLYFMELHTAVRAAIERHNKESGHAYRGHGTHFEAEVRPGVWQRQGEAPKPVELPPARNIHFDDAPSAPSAPSTSSTGKKSYKLTTPSTELTPAQRNALYFGTWDKVKTAAGCDYNLRFAVTRRLLGCVPKVKDMTPDQFRKVIECFEAMLRDAAAKMASSGNPNPPLGSSQDSETNEPF
jgi:hypothetical protein